VPPKGKKDLLLLRHAKSSWDDPALDDFNRPLAKRGRRAALRMAEWLAERQIRPGLVLCSPATRTRETLSLIQPALGTDITVRYEGRLYLAEAEDLLHRLREVDTDVGCVLLIGHNPGLQELAITLASDEKKPERVRLAEKFPTAALAWFRLNTSRWSALRPENGELVAFITPADLPE